MKLIITARAEKDILKLSPDNKKRVDASFEKYLSNPETLDIKKLKGYRNHYRIRVGVYRIILYVPPKEDATYILRVRHRREAY